MTEQRKHLHETLRAIVRAIVDDEEAASVAMSEGRHTCVYEVSVAKADIPRVIGKGGDTAAAIRTILNAAGGKSRERYLFEILE